MLVKQISFISIENLLFRTILFLHNTYQIFLKFLHILLIYRISLVCKFNIFHAVPPFEMHEPASTSLSLDNMTINFFDFQTQNNVVCHTLKNWPSFHEFTNVATFLSFSIASSCTIDVTLAISRTTSHADQQIVSFFFWMYHIADSLT